MDLKRKTNPKYGSVIECTLLVHYLYIVQSKIIVELLKCGNG